MEKKQGKKKKLLQSIIISGIWLFLWGYAAYKMDSPLILPGPMDALISLKQMMLVSSFWKSVLWSLFRIMTGYFIAVLIGFALAFLCYFVSFADALFSPIRTVIRSTPVSSFIILVLLWLNNSVAPVFIVILTVMPIIWTSVQQGLDQTDKKLLEMTQCYHFTHLQRFSSLYMRSVLPHFASACATGLGFAWKSGIAAEVIAKPAFSIGKNLQDAKVYLETSQLFAWTLVVILISLFLEKILRTAIIKFQAAEGKKHD